MRDQKYDVVENGFDTEYSHHGSKGLGILMTALFIVGYQVGAGIVAMPKAMVNAHWGGLGIILLGGLASGYAAIQLGACWSILQKRWPQFRHGRTRKPYAAICDKALGPWAKHLASGSVIVTTFGISVIYLLLAAEYIEHLLKLAGITSLTFCHLILIIAAILTPPSFLGSPKDFWPVAVVSMATSLLACVCIVVGSFVDMYPDPEPVYNSAGNVTDTVTPAWFPNANYPAPTFLSFALGYGAITFAYGGHSALPTFQHDMKKPDDFWKATTLAWAVIVALYIPVGLSGFVVYGELVQQNIVLNITTDWINVSLSLMLTIHLIVSFLISLNPPCQELEEAFGIPHDFNWKRVVIRLGVVLGAVFICESVPSFGLILDLVGSTTMTLNAFILPGACLLALKLQRRADSDSPLVLKKNGHCEASKNNWGDTSRPATWEWVVVIVIGILGIAGGLAGTYAAVHGLFTHEFGTPCYLSNGNVTIAHGSH